MSGKDTMPSVAIAVDFDGTITERDLLDEIAHAFGDPEVYRQVDEGLHQGTITLQECIAREFEPVRASLSEVVSYVLARARLRPGLRELVDLAKERGWPLVVLSSGFRELIEPVLAREGIEAEIRANSVDPSPRGWRVRWRDGRRCPACGEACKRGSLPRATTVIYVGDGISDRCAALACQRVFATRGLARYLDQRGVPYEPFADFHDIVAAIRRE
ncbi:MAG: hypothetical protein C4306_10940 [Thermoleophilia bacterium]